MSSGFHQKFFWRYAPILIAWLRCCLWFVSRWVVLATTIPLPLRADFSCWIKMFLVFLDKKCLAERADFLDAWLRCCLWFVWRQVVLNKMFSLRYAPISVAWLRCWWKVVAQQLTNHLAVRADASLFLMLWSCLPGAWKLFAYLRCGRAARNPHACVAWLWLWWCGGLHMNACIDVRVRAGKVLFLAWRESIVEAC